MTAIDIDAMLAQLRAVGTSPVISWVDQDGYPASSRVEVGDVVGTGVVISHGAGVRLAAGRANLLAHSHNERLWDLKNVSFPGRLEHEDGTFRFFPERQVGSATQRVRGQFRMLRDCGRAARQYLDRRGMDRPTVSYRQVSELKRQARALGID